MKPSRRCLLDLCGAAAALLITSQVATSQPYPARPITMIVPFPAGGPSDTIARLLAEPMHTVLGQPVVIEDVSGANGTIGVGRVARAASDGYTLVIGQVATHVFNGAVYPLQYDLLNDFQPISLLTDSRFLFIAKKAFPPDDLAGLVHWLKANPDKAAAATTGPGSMSQISSIFLQRMTGTRFQFVPYRGSAPAVQSVVAGETDFGIADLITALPQIRGGTVKVYAVAAKSRLAAAPEIPTVDEAGAPGLYVSFWHGLWGPKGMSNDVVAKLNNAVVAALQDPLVRTRLTDLGQEIFPRERQTPEALRIHQKAEIDKWWPIIKDAGIKPE